MSLVLLRDYWDTGSVKIIVCERRRVTSPLAQKSVQLAGRTPPRLCFRNDGEVFSEITILLIKLPERSHSAVNVLVL